MNLYPPSGSRKLTGLYVGIAALLLLAVIGVVCWALFGLPESLFASIAGGITTITGVHQGSQSAADRSPNYPNVPRPPDVP